MNFLNKMERKIGKYAIPNLSLYLILGYVLGYILEFINPAIVDFLTLNPYLILHGQVWRIVTWIIIPPSSFDLFTIIMLMFYYSVGMNLERTWGTFYYNVYLFMGMIFTILGSFLIMGISFPRNTPIQPFFRIQSRFFSSTSFCFGNFLIYAFRKRSPPLRPSPYRIRLPSSPAETEITITQKK